MYAKRYFYCKKFFRQGHSEVVCRAAKCVKEKSEKKKGLLNEEKKREKKMWKVVGGKEHDSGIDYWEQDGTIMTKEEAEQVN